MKLLLDTELGRELHWVKAEIIQITRHNLVRVRTQYGYNISFTKWDWDRLEKK